MRKRTNRLKRKIALTGLLLLSPVLSSCGSLGTALSQRALAIPQRPVAESVLKTAVGGGLNAFLTATGTAVRFND